MVRTLRCLTVAGTLAAATSASADLDRLRFFFLDVEPGFTTVQCWLTFTDPGDTLVSVQGSSTFPLRIEVTEPLFNDVPKDIAGSLLQDRPSPLAGPADSWVTIGGDWESGLTDTWFSSGFGQPAAPGMPVIVGNVIEDPSGGWFDLDPTTPESGEAILIAQLTIPESAVLVRFQGMATFVSGADGSVQTQFFEGPFLFYPDCNDNGQDDVLEILFGLAKDADGDGQPDVCQCPFDLDFDGTVGFSDLTAVLADFGACPGCPTDFNGDGMVGLSDLLALLATWGGC
ncbi:MAG: hypothetical protein AB8G96_16175 [Phycisphaerales bacterium]